MTVHNDIMRDNMRDSIRDSSAVAGRNGRNARDMQYVGTPLLWSSQFSLRSDIHKVTAKLSLNGTLNATRAHLNEIRPTVLARS